MLNHAQEAYEGGLTDNFFSTSENLIRCDGNDFESMVLQSQAPVDFEFFLPDVKLCFVKFHF